MNIIDTIPGASISSIALSFLYLERNKQKKLPEKLRNQLNSVLTKRVDNKSFTQCIIKINTMASKEAKDKHLIIRGRSPAIYNILCLFSIYDTATIKKIFQHYHETARCKNKRSFSFITLIQNNPLPYFFYDVNIEYPSLVKTKLLDNSFDLFTMKLPSPFIHSPNSLFPLLQMVEVTYDWPKIQQHYEQAESYFNNKEYLLAQSSLQKLSNEFPNNFPPASSLQLKINNILQESKDGLDYLNSLL